VLAGHDGCEKAEILPFTGGPTGDVDPCIAPDQSYLIFSSRDRAKTTPNGPSDDGHEHLYFARRRASGWGPVEALRYEGDNWGADDGEAQLAPEGRLGRSVPGLLSAILGAHPNSARKKRTAAKRTA
jgi:hypothetical protein